MRLKQTFIYLSFFYRRPCSISPLRTKRAHEVRGGTSLATPPTRAPLCAYF